MLLEKNPVGKPHATMRPCAVRKSGMQAMAKKAISPTSQAYSGKRLYAEEGLSGFPEDRPCLSHCGLARKRSGASLVRAGDRAGAPRAGGVIARRRAERARVHWLFISAALTDPLIAE